MQKASPRKRSRLPAAAEAVTPAKKSASRQSQQKTLTLTIHGSTLQHSITIHPLTDSAIPLPAERTLVVLGLPVSLDFCIPKLLERCGEIEEYVWNEISPGNASTEATHACYVTFEEPDGLRLAMKLSANKLIELDFSDTSPRPLDGWLKEYFDQYPDPEVVKAHVDRFIFDYDQEKLAARKRNDATLGQVDADGFTLVQKRGRKAVSDGEVHVRGVKADRVVVKEPTTLSDFYRFQKLDHKKNRLAVLREKFEQDKERIAQLKAQRKFRPY